MPAPALGLDPRDTAGRNSSVTRPDTKVVSYQYDAASNRTRLTWPDAFFVTYAGACPRA